MAEGRPPTLKMMRFPDKNRIRHPREIRQASRARGYDARWDRLSVAFRRRNPFCLMCAQEGRDAHANVADHLLPHREFPDLKYDWDNLRALCKEHHDGLKQALEAEARKRGDLSVLVKWVDEPSSRPRHLLSPMFCEGVRQ